VGDELARGEDDHDLLTFAESAIRLREEIEAREEALREDLPAERRAVLQTRLTALTDALRRNSRQADANPGETGFLNYVPPRRSGAEAGGRADAEGEGRP
jgi:hypothetical protein